MCVVFGLCPAVFCVVILISLFTASVNSSISSFVKVCVPCIRKCHIVSFTPFDISVLLILTCTPFLYPYLSIRYVRPFHTLQYLSSALTANLEVIKNEEIDQVTILSKELEKVKDVFDYCIIDCPPDINISVINALVAADEVIIPIKIDGYAFDGMKELEEQINNAKQLNPKLKFRGCLVTMFYNRDVCRQGEEYLQNQRYPVFRTHIRRTEKADEVTFTTQSLMQYSPRSGAARDYKTFVKEYLEG